MARYAAPALARYGSSASLGAGAYPEAFVMYLARFLLRFDSSSSAWWRSKLASLPAGWSDARAQAELRALVGSLGASLAYGLAPFAAADAAGAAALWRKLSAAYGAQAEAPAQLALMFSLLAADRQPADMMRAALPSSASKEPPAAASPPTPPRRRARRSRRPPTRCRPPPCCGPSGTTRRARTCRRPRCSPTAPSASSRARPSRANRRSEPRRALPRNSDRRAILMRAIRRNFLNHRVAISVRRYALFAASGGFGCALTHLTVTPLDVVKTRLQTRPGRYKGFVDGVTTIASEEGAAMLFQGAQATWWGYFAYGVSVYPGYELWKRVLFEMAGPMALYEYRVPLVLLAGALATIVTCFLITPFEAVRIRMVDDPEFAPSLPAAARRFYDEGGVAALYDGLLPLLIRQVLFGMVKFLVFDSCADAIFASMPMEAQDDALITVGVSLLSGAIAGVASAIVSQPADVVLSAVAKGAEPGVEQGSLRGKVDQIALLTTTARGINRQYGFGGFYLGLGSRCLWSGAIIAGQFFLYDVFKTALHVQAADLTTFAVFAPDVLGTAIGAQ